MTRRGLLLAALVITGAALQASVFDRLALPLTRPDLLLVVVAGAGFALGRIRGAVTGFFAGLLADVMPPADHTVGVLALVYALVGYLAGRLEDAEERSVVMAVGAVGVLSVVALLAAAGLAAMTGNPQVHWASVGRSLPLFALYDVVLAPFVVPPVTWLTRRVAPDADLT